MTRDENYVEYMLHVGGGLSGLSLEQLGYERRPEDLSDDERNLLEVDDLEWMESVTRSSVTKACSRQSSWRARSGRRRLY
ncbi:hypothetical protein [Arthrobacter sp. ISL-72]|uniref:hypothetical protein n=1 Tax=Arthrobacter sp. ISL-72 TaxID=2819114 RepID=UPI001BE5AE85|nr:hypothetical protein [Arthrobacter sp. ISL-72]MBT2597911.1 hypothetical protein [Arthrobacter sp. ISL-72]